MSNAIQRIDSNERLSRIVIHNGVVYVAGVTAANTAGDITAQTRDCLAEIDRLLALAGSDKTRILRTQIWLADIAADFAAMNAVWDAWVPQGQTPARATGEAKLAAPEYRVEIIVTAAQG